VTILRVTKLRAGQVMMTSADTISRSRAEPTFEIFAPELATPIAPEMDKN
jgi:hypothetical protein